MTLREWKEAADMRSPKLGLLAVLALGAGLRFWGIGAGIPYAVGVDEPEIVNRANAMIESGRFNPKFFDYPGLYIYLQAAVGTLRFIAGALAGTFTSLADFDTADMYLWGRAVTALLGTATVLVLFRAGLRWGARHALLGAAIFAVHPMHVRESHFVLTDVPMTFFVTLTFALSLGASEAPGWKRFALAGAAAGLAAGTKYNGALALMMPLIAAWPTEDRGRHAAAAVAASALAFLAAAPYTVFDLPAFLDGFARLNAAYPRAAAGWDSGWWTYLKHLRLSFGVVGLALALGGLVLALVRTGGPGAVRWRLLLIFPLLYYWFIGGKGLVFGRYLLPVVPFLSLAAAIAIVSGVSLLRRYSIPRAVRTGLIVVLTAAVLVPPLRTSLAFNQGLVRQTTAQAAWEWLSPRLAPGARVAVEARVMRLPEDVYRVTLVPKLTLRPIEEWRARGYDWLIASGEVYVEGLARTPDFEAAERYRDLFEQAAAVETFTPGGGAGGPQIRVLRLR